MRVQCTCLCTRRLDAAYIRGKVGDWTPTDVTAYIRGCPMHLSVARRHESRGTTRRHGHGKPRRARRAIHGRISAQVIFRISSLVRLGSSSPASRAIAFDRCSSRNTSIHSVEQRRYTVVPAMGVLAPAKQLMRTPHGQTKCPRSDRRMPESSSTASSARIRVLPRACRIRRDARCVLANPRERRTCARADSATNRGWKHSSSACSDASMPPFRRVARAAHRRPRLRVPHADRRASSRCHAWR